MKEPLFFHLGIHSRAVGLWRRDVTLALGVGMAWNQGQSKPTLLKTTMGCSLLIRLSSFAQFIPALFAA